MDGDRTLALSVQLLRTHQVLRDRLGAVRQELLSGGPGTTSPAGVLSHCLSFCAALERHHTGEDDLLLPALRAERPELAPVIDKLVEDHQLIGWILHRVKDLVDRTGTDAATTVGELDGLAAIMESHFAFEERRIGAALDAMGAGAWVAEVFALGAESADGRRGS